MKSAKTRVVVAMSGGVDSSVAAALLVKKGFDVIGICMKLWPSEFCGKEKPKGCCSTRDLEDARFVAGQIGIPFYAFDFSEEFKKEVMNYFSREYSSGRTPNPCIVCNDKIKFGKLLEKAKQLDADFLATGHYAKVSRNSKSGRFRLSRAKDKSKDQSYVLFGLNQDQLSSTIFPLGGLFKSEVRQISKKLKLKTAEKKESQEICFIWDNDYPKFLRNKYGLNPLPGEIIDKKGKVLGRHLGVINFTIGQRRGLGLGGSKEPFYVTGINVSNNRITVGGLEDLKKDTLFADRINWVSIEKPNKPIRIKAKIRYNHMPAAATVKPTSGNKAEVIFDKPQSAITPGQAIVFYKSDIVLGGGWISS